MKMINCIFFLKRSPFPLGIITCNIMLCFNSTDGFFFFSGWNQMVICQVMEIISSQHLKWYLKNFLFYVISLLSPKPWDRRSGCGSQAFVDAGWHASERWYQVPQTSGHLKERPHKSQKLYSFPSHLGPNNRPSQWIGGYWAGLPPPLSH